MKIGINLVGVSYNDGKIGRYRNYEDAIDGFMTNVVNPLKEEGHEISFYLFTYDSLKKEDIIKNIRLETSLCVQKLKEISSDNIEQIEGKIEGQQIVILTKFVRKA